MVMNRLEESMSASNMYNGFVFKKKNVKIDWRKIAGVDLDHVINDFDLRTLQDNIDHITFCNIDSEVDTRIIDPNYLKLFKMSQLMIEYLIHSQNYLTGVISDFEVQLSKSMCESDELKAQHSKMHKELNELKKENKKRKKMIETQQAMLSVTPANYHQCSICSKVFLNQGYLQAHIARRHCGEGGGGGGGVDSLEVEKLRERLRSTEAELYAATKGGNGGGSLTRQMEEFKTEQAKLRAEELHDYEKRAHELNDKILTQGQTIAELQQRLATQSHVGWIRDEVEVDKDAYIKLQQELEKLRGLVANYEDDAKTKAKESHLRQKHAKELSKKDEIIAKLQARLEQMKASAGNADLQQLMLKIDELNAQLQQERAERARLERELADRPPPVVTPRHSTDQSLPSPPPPPPQQPQRAPSASPQRPVQSPSLPALSQQQQQNQPIILTEYCPLTLRNVQKNTRFLHMFRDNAEKSLGQQLDDIGIDYTDKYLPVADYRQKVELLKESRQVIVNDLETFNEYRAVFANIVEQLARQRLSGGSAVTRSSSSSGNRVTFKKEPIVVVSKPKQQPTKAVTKQPEIDVVTEEEEESYYDDDYTDTTTGDNTRPRRVASASPRKSADDLLNELDSVDRTKSLTNIPSATVEENRRKVERQLEESAKKDAVRNGVPMGFEARTTTTTTVVRRQPQEDDVEDEDSFSSITELDAETGKTRAKNGASKKTESSINSWTPQQPPSIDMMQDRPTTATSWKTSNLDSDEFDNGLNE